MRVKPNTLKHEDKIRTLDTLYTAASMLKSRDSVKAFLRDLLTENERIMLGRRILIAQALLEGSSYDKIVDEFGVGKDTIQRIARWLDDQFPGYEKVIGDMKTVRVQRDKKQNEKKLYATSALYRLKKKYPLHFLFFPKPHTD